MTRHSHASWIVFLELLGEQEQFFQERASWHYCPYLAIGIGILIFNKQAYESAKRQHKEYWEWRRNRNEARWVQQERGQLDYDAKNMMHLTRLLFSGESIVKNGRPIVRFTGEKLETLLSIRRGEWEFDRIIAHAETIQARIIDGKDRLPVECDKEKVSDLIAEVMRKAGVQ